LAVLACSWRRLASEVDKAASRAAAVTYSYAAWFTDALALAYVLEATGALRMTVGTLAQSTHDGTSVMTSVKNLHKASISQSIAQTSNVAGDDSPIRSSPSAHVRFVSPGEWR
jgi:hypothetical protein